MSETKFEPAEHWKRYGDCVHTCRKCKEKSALCFHCWHGREMDIDYYCTNCGHSWGVDGEDS